MAWEKQELIRHMDSQKEMWDKVGIRALGKDQILNHFSGGKLSRKDAITANCYICMGGYGDGENRDCENPPCPLYPYMPYNPNRIKKEVSDEQRKASSDRIKKVNAARR